VSRFDSTPEELLGLARDLLDRADPATAGLWPRASAHLGRQAVELALDDLWVKKAPGVEESSARAQLICLPTYVEDEELAERVNHVWWVLTRAGHHHPYELAPTAAELSGWIADAEGVVEKISSVAAESTEEAR
jgi:hypothetical protein